MVTIKGMYKTLTVLLGSQECVSTEKYRRNTYSFVLEDNGTKIAYNVLTGEIVELSDVEFDVLQQESVEFAEEIRELIAKWFLVPVDYDDFQLSDEISDFLKMIEKKEGIVSYTIFTTMDCNARCFYCYELGRPRTPMSHKTAEDTANFILNNTSKGKKVFLHWFGGEPLYNLDVIDIIVSRLAKEGIEFQSKMTTNGYLFDEKLAAKAKNIWKMKSVQISLDGTEAVYNKTKAYVNSKGVNSFKLVTDNIERLLKNDIYVSIRLNLGEHNYQDLYNLVDFLAERYKNYDNISVYSHQLFNYQSPSESPEKRVEIAKNLISLESYAQEKGILRESSLKNEPVRHYCMADSPKSVTILPSGKLGKCEHFSEDNFVGSIYDGIVDLDIVAEFSEKEGSREICEKCALYPSCIQLKKCPDVFHGFCDAGYRIIMEAKLIRKIWHTYRKLKNEKLKKES